MNLYYESYGAGRLLVLIPGFASGLWTWYCQTGALAENFRVVTFDPRGIGRSAAGPDELRDLSMNTFVADVRGLLDELEIERAHVLGASFGGFVAQEFALRFPGRVDKLILACTSAGGANHVRPAPEILRSFAPDPGLPIGEKIRRFIRPAFTDEFNAERAGEVEKACRLRESSPVADAVYLAQLEAAFSFSAEGELGRIENETLVLSGDRDTIVPLPNSVNLAEKLPRARLKIIENGSHLFFIENSHEFNRTVTDFLQE